MIHSNLIKVEGYANLVRDNNSSAILNTNNDELLKHRARRKMMSNKDLQVNSLLDRVQSLENLVEKLLNNYNKDISE
jgi:hypothetical protein